MSLTYRPEIDGLRCIAVSSVVLYHAEIANLGGGFVGVDIFFVISGYLITKILLSDLSGDGFSYVEFYERRARRILPALFAMLLVIVPASRFFLLPSQYDLILPQVASSLLFVANIFFWKSSGYFEPESSGLPFLHMWSLGIEEQFYLFAPPFLALVYFYVPKLLKPALLVSCLLSFVASIVLTPGHPVPSFYLLPTRAWELGAGGLLAAGYFSFPKSAWVRETLSSLGLVLLLGSIFFLNDEMSFPGVVAMFPVAGSALIILSSSGTYVGRLLSLRPVVWIGLISYSLYLWHWPVLVLGREAGIIFDVSTRLIAVIFSIALAYLSWRFVEAPFRSKRLVPQTQLVVSLTSLALIVVAVTIALNRPSGWPHSPNVVAYDRAREDFSPMRARCHLEQGLGTLPKLCQLGGKTAQIVVWADSHGVELSAALSERVPILQATYSACPPAPGVTVPSRPLCDEHNDLFLKELIESSNLQQVVMIARYEIWMDDPAFLEGFLGAIERLTQAGKEVVIVGPIPSPGFNVPTALARGSDKVYARAAFDRRNQEIVQSISDIPGTSVVMPSQIFCGPTECSLVTELGDPVLFDSDHASMAAARLISEQVLRQFQSQS